MTNNCPHCGKPFRTKRTAPRETRKEITLRWCQYCRWTPGLQKQTDGKTSQHGKET